MASVVLIIALSWGGQTNCEPGSVSADASAGRAVPESAELYSVGPAPSFLVGSPELWKFRRINMPVGSR